MLNSNTPIHTPKSLEELDAIAEQFRDAMADVFDFQIGPKRQQKLREAVCRALGFPNGLQQLQASFPEDLSKRIGYPDSLPEVVVLKTSDYDPDIFSVIVGANNMTPLKRGGIKEEQIDEGGNWPETVDLCEEDEDRLKDLFDMSSEELELSLKGHYRVEAVYYMMPDVGKYGVGPMGIPEKAAEMLLDDFGFRPSDSMEHDVDDIGDGGDVLYLKLVKNKKG